MYIIICTDDVISNKYITMTRFDTIIVAV